MMAGAACLLVPGMLVAAAQTAPAKSDKDVLIFTNGDQLSGTLERSIDGNVLFKSDVAGEITVPYAQIKQLRTHGKFAILQHGVPVAVSKQVVPVPIEITADTIHADASSQAGAASYPVKNVAYVVDEKTFEQANQSISFFSGWNGAVNFGASTTQATISGGSLTAGIALVRQIPVVPFFRVRNRTLLNFQQIYGSLTTPAFIDNTPEDVTAKTNIMHADIERDEYMSKKLYVFGTAAFDHNYAQSVALQQLYGGGLGYTAFNTPVHQLDFKADTHYERQGFFNSANNLNLIGSTFGEAYRRNLPMKMLFTQTAAYIPAWNHMSAYAANGSATLTAPLFKRLALNLSAVDSFINNPDVGYKKNSFTFTTGITYTLR